MKQEEARCPYFIVDDKFPAMSILSNGRLICKNCGHISFAHDIASRCPCQKCFEISFSPRGSRITRWQIRLEELREVLSSVQSNLTRVTSVPPTSGLFPISKPSLKLSILQFHGKPESKPCSAYEKLRTTSLSIVVISAAGNPRS
jgi:hypothetical protein